MTAANLGANLAFFLTHPLVTPCHSVSIAMLSLWASPVALRKRWTATLRGKRPMRDHDMQAAESARIQQRMFP